MAVFVFWWLSWQPPWICESSQPSNQFIDHITELLDPENIPLDTKLIFLQSPECKIWLLLYIDGHLGSHLGFFICPQLGFLRTFSMLIRRPNWNAFHKKKSVAICLRSNHIFTGLKVLDQRDSKGLLASFVWWSELSLWSYWIDSCLELLKSTQYLNWTHFVKLYPK